MKIELYKSLWGMTGPLEAQLERIKAAGYVGIETPIGRAEDLPNFTKLLEKHQLKYIAMFFTGGGPSWSEHAKSFDEQLRRSADYNPVKVTVHSGKDSFSFDDACRFYDSAVTSEARQNISVGHETHRGRVFFTPWVTAAILAKFPTLKVCADFSHWCCVCESMLDDQNANLASVIARTLHIHSRVGYEEGPQVTDPAAPEYKRHLDRHLQWWDAMVAHLQSTGAGAVTITPEFGPPAYQHTLPYTQQPLTDLWSICLWTGELLRNRYSPAPA